METYTAPKIIFLTRKKNNILDGTFSFMGIFFRAMNYFSVTFKERDLIA